MGGPVAVEVAGEAVTVEDDGEAADPAPVEHHLQDVEELLLELGLVLGDGHAVLRLGVVPHGGEREDVSAHLAGRLAVVGGVVAELERFQLLFMFAHVLGKTFLFNIDSIANITAAASKNHFCCFQVGARGGTVGYHIFQKSLRCHFCRHRQHFSES